MVSKKHICMLAAENDVIAGAKVGGIGDVVRDMPRALANEDTAVTVVIPAYGLFHQRDDAEPVSTFTTQFAGSTQRIEMFEVCAGRDENVRYLVMHNPLFAPCGIGRVYCDDDDNQPFATDASKFALFCAASLSALSTGCIEDVNVLHLHDWHAALALVLLRFDPAYQSLKDIRTVYSIHNLALQGVRPFAGDNSSLQSWFPHLHYDPALLADPRWPHCANPVAGAIRLADKVHTVSPTYATEILLPNNRDAGFHGGEGLEQDLQRAEQGDRLIGIVNGIHYPDTIAKRLAWQEFTQQMADELLNLIARQTQLSAADYVVHQRILSLVDNKRPAHVLTSVGRLTDQKMSLLLGTLNDGSVALDSLMKMLSGKGLFILLGSGDTDLEKQCQLIASRHPHLLFINRYSEKLSELLFANGDLFLMPSSFEPCGISQMLAMRDGQPCVAHSVGGLRDTIDDEVDGFLFSGDTKEAQSSAMLARVDEVLTMRETKRDGFTRIVRNARTLRFKWSDSASRYQSELY